MRPSNLELRGYFVTELNVSANARFDPNQSMELTINDLDVQPTCLTNEEDPRHWQIRLRVRSVEDGERNTPYAFNTEVVGFFTVADAVPLDAVPAFAHINGASILYGVAREALRGVMAQGPHLPLLLPTVCFLETAPETLSPEADSDP